VIVRKRSKGAVTETHAFVIGLAPEQVLRESESDPPTRLPDIIINESSQDSVNAALVHRRNGLCSPDIRAILRQLRA